MTHSRHSELKPDYYRRCKKENPYIDAIYRRTDAESYVKDRKKEREKKREGRGKHRPFIELFLSTFLVSVLQFDACASTPCTVCCSFLLICPFLIKPVCREARSD